MSWLTLLAKSYDGLMCSDIIGDDRPLPISHTTQNADVEVLLTEDGNFLNARVIVEKSEKSTVIPATEDSANRTNGPVPHPLFDRLQYVAGDYSEWGGLKGTKSHLDYMSQLGAWCESANANNLVKIVYRYLQKNCLIADLVQIHILISEPDKQKLLEKWDTNLGDKPAIFKAMTGSQLQSDAFIRFSVQTGPDSYVNLWESTELSDCYVAYTLSQQEEKGLCYASGKVVPLSSKHPSKIRNTGDKAKLISAHDDSGFTYLGRFLSAEEGAQISYEISQKAHNALKWLIQKQGRHIGDRVFLVWGSTLPDFPNLLGDSAEIMNPERSRDNEPIETVSLDDDVSDETSYNPRTEFAERFNQAIMGYSKNIKDQTELAILILDSATTGRMSINFYREYPFSEIQKFFQNIEEWHVRCAWTRRGNYIEEKKQYEYYLDAPSLYDITMHTFGVERSGKMDLDDKVKSETIQRLLQCIIDQKAIPEDIVRAIETRAKMPQTYSKNNWQKTITIACSVTRYHRLTKYGENWDENLNQHPDSLAYNLGRMLAVANHLEYSNIPDGEKGRETSAIRYFSKFMENPCQTWSTISKLIMPYWQRAGEQADWLHDHRAGIANLIDPAEFAMIRNLDGRALIGFDLETRFLFANKEQKTSFVAHEFKKAQEPVASLYTEDLTYNLGRMLAVYDEIEHKVEADNVQFRISNALQHFAQITEYPCQSWGALFDRLQSYLNQLKQKGYYWDLLRGQIAVNINLEEFTQIRHLDGRLLLGFDAQKYLLHYHGVSLKANIIAFVKDDNNISFACSFGQLIACAHNLERSVLFKEEKNRATNAIRYLSKLREYPDRTWQILQKQLKPYLKRSDNQFYWYSMRTKQILDQMDQEKFQNAYHLNGSIYLSFDAENYRIYANKKYHDEQKKKIAKKQEDEKHDTFTEQN